MRGLTDEQTIIENKTHWHFVGRVVSSSLSKWPARQFYWSNVFLWEIFCRFTIGLSPFLHLFALEKLWLLNCPVIWALNNSRQNIRSMLWDSHRQSELVERSKVTCTLLCRWKCGKNATLQPTQCWTKSHFPPRPPCDPVERMPYACRHLVPNDYATESSVHFIIEFKIVHSPNRSSRFAPKRQWTIFIVRRHVNNDEFAFGIAHTQQMAFRLKLD